MARALFTISIESIQVVSNGDDPGQHDKGKNNAIVASLEYPRSGAPSVLSTRLLDLVSNTSYVFAPKTFWTAGLFKEEIQGSSRLKIVVTDRDKTPTIEKFFTRFVAALMGAALGTITGGIGNALLGAVAKFAIKEYTGTISIGDDHVQTIAETAIVDLDPQNPPISPLTIPFTAPADVIATIAKIENGTFVRRQEILVKKGAPNGHIVLKIEAVRL